MMKTLWSRVTPKALLLSAFVAAASAQALPANAQSFRPPANAPQGDQTLNGGTFKFTPAHVRPNASGISPLTCGVQFSSWIAPNATQLWFTYGWNPANTINWSLMDDTPWDNGQVTLSNVAEDRNKLSSLTYWITIQNKSANWKLFEARYCFLQ